MVSLKLSLSRSTSNSSMIADDWEEMQRPSTEAPPKLEQKMSSAASFASSSSSSLANPDIGIVDLLHYFGAMPDAICCTLRGRDYHGETATGVEWKYKY